MIGGVAAAAAVRTWPFRVYSFPNNANPTRFDILDMRYWGGMDFGEETIWYLNPEQESAFARLAKIQLDTLKGEIPAMIARENFYYSKFMAPGQIMKVSPGFFRNSLTIRPQRAAESR